MSQLEAAAKPQKPAAVKSNARQQIVTPGKDPVIGGKLVGVTKHGKKKPAAKPNASSLEANLPLETPICPVVSLAEVLLTNKTVGANRTIFVKSEIRQRGNRGYMYYVPDQGFYFWSYRPLGDHQAH